MSDLHSHAHDLWRRHAMFLSRLVQAGWWWSFFAKGLLAGAAGMAVALITLRITGRSMDAMLPGFLLFLCAWGWLALRRSRPRRLSEEQALSRLDVSMGLNHRLVSARDGVGPWPEPPENFLPPLTWDLTATLPPPLLSACLLLSALWLPLPAAPEDARVHREEPPAWGETAALVEALKREELVRPEALESLEKELQALREKPREEWFRQGTMETTEQMRQQVERDARNLHQSLSETAALLGAAAEHAERLSPEMREQMAGMLNDLLNQLEQGTLPLSEELLAELQQIDLENLPRMSEAQLRELEERIAQACEAMGECMGEGGMPKEGDADALAKIQAMLEALGASGKPGDSPGESPLTFTEPAAELSAQVPLPLSNPDMSRAALGDLLTLADGEHEVDPTDTGGAAGAIQEPGGAGEAVWRDALLPDEEKRMRSFFQ